MVIISSPFREFTLYDGTIFNKKLKRESGYHAEYLRKSHSTMVSSSSFNRLQQYFKTEWCQQIRIGADCFKNNRQLFDWLPIFPEASFSNLIISAAVWK